VLLLCTIPWSPWIFRTISRSFLKDSEKFAVRSLMILWMLGILIFFSLPKSKLVGYILPALPALACLIADVIVGWLRSSKNNNAAAWIGFSVVGASAFCVAIIVGIARFVPSDVHALSSSAKRQFLASDQIVMLDEYQYDLPFYLQAEKSAWVVGDWNDLAIPKSDNWRKELYDAGQFNPTKMRDALISPDEFLSRLCAHPEITFWVWGKTEQSTRYAFLAKQTSAFSTAKKSLWRLDEQSRQQLKLCGERPSDG